ncbi:YceD family protein [Penaeicola halotolerans]|uniref:YceD family protein n=1 Tax=Penaeicola halotolerans TaxID=2793196 RepID=UPI001CF8F74A|nr:DUF177 domain-containing protein [Penaeicola halotolerans]
MNLKQYNIDIYGLKEGIHSFEFEIKNDFFAYYENDIVKEGDLKALVTLNKTSTMINMTMEIDGKVSLTCDRSLEEFDFPIQITEKVIYKFGEEYKEVSEEIVIITRDTQSINVGQILFEIICLQVPVKKIHPDYRTEEDDDEDYLGGVLVYSSEIAEDEDIEEVSEGDESDDPIEPDPRWSKLKDLKNKFE